MVLKNMPVGEIIIIGDEILGGEVLDTNSFDVAKELAEAGFSIARMTAIGDEPAAIKRALREAIVQADFVVITGGLGPTWDDKTVKAVSEELSRPLERNQEAYNHLQAVLAKAGRPFLPGHEKMVILPKGSKPLGIAYRACGFKLEYQGKPLYFLPGVPHQMRQILKEKVLADLKVHFPDVTPVYKKVLRIFGLSETEMQEKIAPILAKFKEIKVSSLPRFPEVHLVLRGKNKETVEKMAREVKATLGISVFGEDEETLPAVVGKLLLKQGFKLATAESLTGGLIGHLLTQVPGSSAYFDRGAITYSNQSKIEILAVPKEVIDQHGPVSEPTARYMAEGVRKLAQTQIGLAVTGYAGPTGGPEAPVGTVFVGLCVEDKTEVKRFQFQGTREEIKLLTAFHALDTLRRHLLS